jgi:exosome complex component RRP42
MTNLQKNHMLSLLEKGYRFDSRKFDEFREISVEAGFIDNAEGSARVKIGNTEVIAGVKMSVEKPYPDTPNKGGIVVNVELLPLSHLNYEPGPPQIKAIELARVVDRGIRESNAIDFESLCVEEGEKVWTLFIDLCSINDDGNLNDAFSLAALAAIKNAKFPEYVDGKIDYKKKTANSVKMNWEPIEVTVFKIGKYLIVDPTLEEELMVDARLTVAGLADNTICALQKGGDVAISIDEIEQMTELALKNIAILRKKV